MKVRHTVAAAVALAGLISGCESAVAGSPTATMRPNPTGETSEGPSESDRLSPPVEHPKNLRGVDPCELLTPTQETELGLTKPGDRDTSQWGEEGCGLDGPVVSLGFSPNTTLGDGLDRAYRAKANFENFQPSEVDGYPAVRVNFAAQSCGLIVGVSDDQTLNMELTRVSPDAPGKGDPCGFAESIMSDVLTNLPDA